MEVSIITVCYNSEKTIERTIKSVLNQTYQDYEYIIVDGASTDKTLDIIKRYEPEFEGKMRWISEQDNGIYYAMNKGIGMAKGKLIGMINIDDYYDFMLRMYEDGRITFRPVYKLIANFSLGGMCASSKAYLELLDVRFRHGIISEKEYRTLLFKDKVYKLLHGNR